MLDSSGKFIESFEIDEWEVETEDGFKPITHIHKTKKFKVCILKTKSFELKCADEHIVIGKGFKEIYVKDLNVNDELITRNGLEKVEEIIETEDETNMYDLTLDSENHTFFTGGILSHNSTIASIYLVWYALFNPAKTVAILANKEKTAKEILRRIKYAYEGFPKWLQQGVADNGWSETKISLENGSRIICSSTASTAIRGESIARLFLDEFSFVPANVAEEFMASVYPTISSGKTSKIIIASCVTKDAYVYTDKGIRSIESFIDNSQDKTYTIDAYNVLGRDRLRTGSVFHNDGIQETRIINTKSASLECSYMHRFWACKNGKYGIYRAHELEPGDFVSIQYGMNIWGNDDDISDFKQTKGKNRILLDIPSAMTEDIAYLLGLYISEGCRKKSPRGVDGITITCGDDISPVLRSLNLQYIKQDIKYHIHSRNLIDFLEYLGFDLSKKAPEKEIPERLLKMSRSNIAALLQGIYDGDGYSVVNRGYVGIGLSSLKLIKQIRVILMNFGILTDFNICNSRPTDKVKVFSMNYRIVCNAYYSKLFYDLIGFRLERKQLKSNYLTDEYKVGNHYDLIPFSREILKTIRKDVFINFNILKGNAGKDNKHFSRGLLLKHKDYLHSINNHKIDELLENVSDTLKWEPIKTIEKSQNEVFDFSLPDNEEDKWDHSVIHNGFNCFQTPNGLNHFYHIYRGAVKQENNFRPVKINWWEVPGRDEKWKESVIKDIGIVKWNQEYAARFIGSSKTLIDPDLLERLGNYTEEPIDLHMGDLMYLYEKPIENAMYILGVDTAKGVNGDYSVVQVLKINDEHDIDQVAIYRCNTIDPHTFCQVVMSISNYYNKAYCMIENNDVGGQVADSMWYEYEFDRILNCDKKGIGIRSTRKSKLAGNLLIKRYFENGWIHIRDKRTIYELTQYEETTPDVFQASSGENDDCVTSLMWGLYFLTTVFFDGKDISVKTIDPKFLLEKQEEEDMPVMFINGNEIESMWV